MKLKLRKINSILPRNVKIKLIILTVGIIFGALIETMTLSIMQPFIMIITDPEIIYTNQILYFVYSLLGFSDTTFFLAFFATAIAMVYVFRGLYVYFLARIQNRFIAGNSAILSNRLLIQMLRKPYIFHANNNLVKLQGLVVRQSERLYGAANSALQLFIDVFMTLFILVFLFISSLYMTLVVLFFAGICTLVYFRIFKRKMESSGDEEERGMILINKSVMQALNGIKEIKASHREKFFTEKFKKIRLHTVAFKAQIQSLRQLPRLFMESLCFSGAFLVVTVVILVGVDMSVLLPQLGIFMLAAFKMFPAISRILSISTQVMRQSKAIPAIHDILFEKDEYDYELPLPTEIIISHDIVVSGMLYRYPKTKRPVFKNVSFTIPYNTSVAFVGPSGMGKSTLVDIILGILTPQSGSVTFNGKSIHHNNRGWVRKIGYVPQAIYLMDDTLRANIAFGIEDNRIDEAQIWNALEQAQLADFVRELPDGLDTEVGERGVRLSGGQRQRIGIARALYHNPPILVFDEATSNLDRETESAVMEAIRSLQGKKTMIIVAHRLSTIEHCDIIYRIKKGKVKQLSTIKTHSNKNKSPLSHKEQLI